MTQSEHIRRRLAELWFPSGPGYQLLQDALNLVAEVDRLKAEVEQLQADRKLRDAVVLNHAYKALGKPLHPLALRELLVQLGHQDEAWGKTKGD